MGLPIAVPDGEFSSIDLDVSSPSLKVGASLTSPIEMVTSMVSVSTPGSPGWVVPESLSVTVTVTVTV